MEDAEDAVLDHYKSDLPSLTEDEMDEQDQRLSDDQMDVVDTVRENNPDGEAVEEALNHYDDDDVTIDPYTEAGYDEDLDEEDAEEAMVTVETLEDQG